MNQIYQFRTYKGCSFIRLMMQDTSTGKIFDNKIEARHYTDPEKSNYKFSIIDQIKDIQRYDTKYYEFLHCFSENNVEICNHWKQTTSPLDYTEQSLSVDYQKIGLIQLNPQFSNFKGLMLSTEFGTLLDGENTSLPYWRYAAGVCKNYMNNYLIPGPTISGKVFDVHHSTLYLRILNKPITCRNINHLKFRPAIFLFILSK